PPALPGRGRPPRWRRGSARPLPCPPPQSLPCTGPTCWRSSPAVKQRAFHAFSSGQSGEEGPFHVPAKGRCRFRRGPVEPLVHRCVKFRAAEGSARRGRSSGGLSVPLPTPIGDVEFPGVRGLVAEQADELAAERR